MFTDLPNLIFKARETVNTNIFFYLALLYNDINVVPMEFPSDRNDYIVHPASARITRNINNSPVD